VTHTSHSGGHNVYAMASANDFASCVFTGGTNLGASSPVAYTVPSDAVEGSVLYFGCEVDSHCSSGQKLAVTIAAPEASEVVVDCQPYGCDDAWCMDPCAAGTVYDATVGECGKCVDEGDEVEVAMTCMEAYVLFAEVQSSCPHQCDEDGQGDLPACSDGQPSRAPETCGTTACADGIMQVLENLDAMIAGWLTCVGDYAGIQAYGQMGADYWKTLMNEIVNDCGLSDAVTVEFEKGTCAFGVDNISKLDQ